MLGLVLTELGGFGGDDDAQKRHAGDVAVDVGYLRYQPKSLTSK